jgi:hypothetical protein
MKKHLSIRSISLALMFLVLLGWVAYRGQQRSNPSQTSETASPIIQNHQAKISQTPRMVSVPSTTASLMAGNQWQDPLLDALRKGDVAQMDNLFREMEASLLNDPTPEQVARMIAAANDASLPLALRQGLVKAMIEGASGQVVEGLVKLYHMSTDEEIKEAILNHLPDLQGKARLLGQGTNVSDALMTALNLESDSSPLLHPLAVALTKMPDAKALSYMVDQICNRADTVAKINASTDPRLDALLSVIMEQRLLSDAPVDMLAAQLSDPSSNEARKWVCASALASVGSPLAIEQLMRHMQACPSEQLAMCQLLLGRLVHPDAKTLLTGSLAAPFQSDEIRQAVRMTAEQLPD